MTLEKSLSRVPMVVAWRTAVVAVLLVVTWGYLELKFHAEPMPAREPLEQLPYDIADWSGNREPDFDSNVMNVLGVDDYALRSYRRPGAPSVGLYVGYYSSQRQGDTVHSPLNCLPGAGWVPTEIGRRTLSVADGVGQRSIEVNRVVIQKGLDRQLVFYWYQGHGRVVASEYWGKVYLVTDAIRMNRTDGALVRVMVPIADDGREAEAVSEQAAVSFARDLFPLLGRYLPS